MHRILIIHYHLNPGGVTRIIESQVQALKKQNPPQEIIILTGHRDDPQKIQNAGARLIVEERLNYLSEISDFNAEKDYLNNFFNGILNSNDIIHFHNLNLGKNPILTFIISELANSGYRVINHIHDFAEDRPENYQFMERVIAEVTDKPIKEILYPPTNNIFYIVLTTFDRNKLIRLVVNQKNIHVLPNPVILPSIRSNVDLKEQRSSILQKFHLDHAKKIVTYPVRVIRRKNIGEYILLCFLFRDKANWLVTQPPRNPVEIKSYNQWKKFCSEYEIPLLFEAGLETDYEMLIRCSDFCFTTSIREGFGMAYLEPWILGVPVIGRNLPNVTHDFIKTGLVFPLLYNEIKVTWNCTNSDFASLTEATQRDIIAELIKDHQKSEEIISHNRFLEKLLISVDQTLIDKNKALILQEFSLENYAKRLNTIYRKITE